MKKTEKSLFDKKNEGAFLCRLFQKNTLYSVKKQYSVLSKREG